MVIDNISSQEDKQLSRADLKPASDNLIGLTFCPTFEHISSAMLYTDLTLKIPSIKTCYS